MVSGTVARDIHDPLPSGDYLLVIIDEYSTFVEVGMTNL